MFVASIIKNISYRVAIPEGTILQILGVPMCILYAESSIPLKQVMSPAVILSTHTAASLQRVSLKQDLVGSPSNKDDICTVFPALCNCATEKKKKKNSQFSKYKVLDYMQLFYDKKFLGANVQIFQKQLLFSLNMALICNEDGLWGSTYCWYE